MLALTSCCTSNLLNKDKTTSVYTYIEKGEYAFDETHDTSTEAMKKERMEYNANLKARTSDEHPSEEEFIAEIARICESNGFNPNI